MNVEYDLMERFVRAVAAAFPQDATRDRFGRYNGWRNTDALQKLVVALSKDYPKLVPNGGYDTQDQAGMCARAIIAFLDGEEVQ